MTRSPFTADPPISDLGRRATPPPHLTRRLISPCPTSEGSVPDSGRSAQLASTLTRAGPRQRQEAGPQGGRFRAQEVDVDSVARADVGLTLPADLLAVVPPGGADVVRVAAA